MTFSAVMIFLQNSSLMREMPVVLEILKIKISPEDHALDFLGLSRQHASYDTCFKPRLVVLMPN
jgi:hypothetical protein